MPQKTGAIPIVGCVRFSVLTEDYYAERFGTVERIAEHIFAPERLELRFKLFETLCLPAMTQQTDLGFRCVILTSTLLPADARARLDALIAPHPHLSIYAAPPQKHYPLTRAAYFSALPEGAKRWIFFRIDDDDAVSLDYIERLRRIADCLDGLHPNEQFAIAFNHGFYLELSEDESENSLIDGSERNPLSVGVALLSGGDDERSPYRYNHRMLATRYNLYSDMSATVFLRSVHRDNKSDPKKLGPADTMKRREVDRQVRERFGLDPDKLRAL
ncbi:glycosyltransferase [Rhodalgimonas zhirmunskyi]|uniref:Rhamnosyl transferase n=1 Tax=Rhodalgimonas zhirmunskyi TaxID=2964767 RepID=A0AAJ1X6Q9_9RHOB|nr:glycosyltransferase [Rhodoalgimonas zhirmunskyi]MDQ2095751.1 putative rhamnosyl transferase [Rhodoalgimonas zhirmunskyi]